MRSFSERSEAPAGARQEATLNTGAAIVLGSILIGGGIAVSGVVAKVGEGVINNEKMAVCWAPDLGPD